MLSPGAMRVRDAMLPAELILAALVEASRVNAQAKEKSAKAAARSKGRKASEAAEGLLWAALAERVLPLLEKRGEKVKLGRELGVSRQQIHAYFKTRTAAPDAERTLRLIVWLVQAEGRPAEASNADGGGAVAQAGSGAGAGA
jgi:hypothetical protein